MDDQARLSREFLEKKDQREEREAQLKSLLAEFEKQALIRHVDDETTRKLAAENMVKLLAARSARPEPDGSIDWHMHSGVIDKAIGQANETEALNRQREQEANLARQEELVARAHAPQQEPGAEETRKRQLLDNAKALGAKDDVEAASWVAQAETSDRQHGRGGRYDILKGVPPNNNPSSSRGGSPNDPPPRNPTSPTPSPPPSPTKGPLSANEILQRFGNPELEARYQQEDQQRREQQAKSGSTTRPETAASVIARSNTPAETGSNTDLMSVFSTAATKKKAEEEQAKRANDPSKSLGRGGRGR
jgi:hypothetical protein